MWKYVIAGVIVGSVIGVGAYLLGFSSLVSVIGGVIGAIAGYLYSRASPKRRRIVVGTVLLVAGVLIFVFVLAVWTPSFLYIAVGEGWEWGLITSNLFDSLAPGLAQGLILILLGIKLRSSYQQNKSKQRSFAIFGVLAGAYFGFIVGYIIWPRCSPWSIGDCVNAYLAAPLIGAAIGLYVTALVRKLA